MNFLQKKWKYSKIKFYIKNAIWNYKFWLLCKKKYKTISYIKQDTRMLQRENLSKKRFEGYSYKGKLYLDNPGLQNLEKDVWLNLKNKGVL